MQKCNVDFSINNVFVKAFSEKIFIILHLYALLGTNMHRLMHKIVDCFSGYLAGTHS